MPKKNDHLPDKAAAQIAELDKQDRARARLLNALDKEVAKRGQARLAEVDSTAKITKMAVELRQHGVTQEVVAQHVQVMDVKTRTLRPITRQGLYLMMDSYKEKLEPKATPAARRREEDSSPGLNAEAFR